MHAWSLVRDHMAHQWYMEVENPGIHTVIFHLAFYSAHCLCFVFCPGCFDAEQTDKMGGPGRGLYRAHTEPHPPIGQRVWRPDLQSQ